MRHVEPLLTIPVRSSNNRAPRLHQSQASVILDTPPISVHIQGDQVRSRVVHARCYSILGH